MWTVGSDDPWISRFHHIDPELMREQSQETDEGNRGWILVIYKRMKLGYI